jgi:hypothetical protein
MLRRIGRRRASGRVRRTSRDYHRLRVRASFDIQGQTVSRIFWSAGFLRIAGRTMPYCWSMKNSSSKICVLCARHCGRAGSRRRKRSAARGDAAGAARLFRRMGHIL